MSIFDALDVTFDSSSVSFDGYPVVPNFPIVTIEAAFGYGVATPIASMVWTPIGKWVLKVDTQRGKQHERNVVQAGTATFLLDNRDGRFSPWNTSSPYSGNVLPMVPIRIVATWAGVDYPVWFGYVESWPQKWHDAVNSEVEVTAVDGFAILALKKLLESGFRKLVDASTPRSYWRLGDPPNSPTVADTSGNGHTGIYFGTPSLGQPGGVAQDADAAVSFAGAGPNVTAASWAQLPQAGAVAGTEDFTIMFLTSAPFVSVSSHLGQGTPTALQGGVFGWRFTGAQTVVVGSPTLGSLYFDIEDGTGSKRTGVTNSATVNVAGGWHHVAATRSGVTTKLYYDGLLVATGTDTTTRSVAGDIITLAPIAAVTLDEVALFPSALSDSTIAALAAAAIAPWAGQTTDQRIGAVLDLAGWPSADRDLETGNSVVAAPSTPLVPTAVALQHILDVTNASDGLFYMAADGRAAFRSRHHVLLAATSTTSQVTFGGGVGEEPYRLDGTDVGSDALDIWNQASVSRPNAAPQVAADATSVARYGPRTLETDGTWIASDAEAFDRAGWDVGHYKDPLVRVGALNIDLRSDPTVLFPKILGLDFLDRVTFKRETLDGGATFQADQLLEGVDHHITPSSWHAVPHLAPAGPGGYWIWGSAQWGSTTKWAY